MQLHYLLQDIQINQLFQCKEIISQFHSDLTNKDLDLQNKWNRRLASSEERNKCRADHARDHKVDSEIHPEL